MTTAFFPSLRRHYKISIFLTYKSVIALLIFFFCAVLSDEAQSHLRMITSPSTLGAAQGAKGSTTGLPTGYGWHQLSNTVMTSICLGNVPNGMYTDPSMTTTTNYDFDCNQIVPWSGGAADDNNQRLIVWGGGHSDYAGNEVSVLNLNGTPSWQAFTTPTRPVPYVDDGNSWEGLNPYFVRLKDGGQYQPGGSPSSRHTYNGVQYVPYQNKLYSFGGSLANAGSFSQETWTLDMGTAAWTMLGPPFSLAPWYPTGAYNPSNGHIVMHDKSWSLLDFDPHTGLWTTLTGNYHIDDGTTAAVDPINNLFVVVGAQGSTNNLGYPTLPTTQTVQAFMLTPPYVLMNWSDPSCDLVYRNGGLAWDGALGLMVGYPGGGNQAYLLNTSPQPIVTPFGTVPSYKCLDVPISLNPSPVKGVDYPQDPEGSNNGNNLGIFGRFAYFPSLDTFVVMNDRTRNAWTVQLTGGGSSPKFTASISPGAISIPEGSQGTSTISTAVSGGFNNTITLSAVGMPQGVSVSFSPATIAAPGAGTSTIAITVAATTPTGTYPIVVSASGGGDTANETLSLTVTANGQPNFAISASPATLTIQQGNQGASVITTTVSGGFNSSISLSASGMPAGTTVSFNPQTIPAPGAGSSGMIVITASNTPVGTYPITVTGNGGGIQQNTIVTLTVIPGGPGFTLSALPPLLTVAQGNQGTSTITTVVSGGFNNSISLSASGMPTGTTVSFNPQTIPAPGSGNATMTVTVGSSTPVGTYPLTVTGNGGGIQQNATVTLTVTSGGPFTISALPTSLTVAQGNQGASVITTTISSGFNSAISLSASGLPSGTTVSFTPNPIPAPGSGTSGMFVSVGSGTPAGTYPITVTGSGGGYKQTATVTLKVTAQSQPNFTIAASPSSLTIQQGNQGASTITTTISGGFNNAISLSASGVPSGTTVSFNPNPIPAPGSGNSTITITVGSSTPVGTYPITMTGNGGGIQQNTTVTLTVTAQQQANFAISASPSSLTIQQGNQGTSTVTTTVSGGFNNAITLSASGAPSGTTVSFAPNPIPAPGSGNSTMTVTVGSSTPAGTYPITVTGSGGGIQQNATVSLTVSAASGGWQQGFDFRNTSTYITDPAGDTYILSSTAYPTKRNGVTFGWVKTSLVQARDRSTKVDPRLAGINYVNNGSPATFNVDLPAAGSYNLTLAMGDEGYPECYTQCQVQFLDGSTVLATVSEGLTNTGYFYDAKGRNWSAAAWPGSNLTQQVTLTGTRLTVVVGTSKATGDLTPIAFLGVAQVSSGSPSFAIAASPSLVTIQQGNQGTSTITTTIDGGFNGSIALSASGVPSGTTVSFNPNPTSALESANSTMTITVGASTPVGTYPITVTANGGGTEQNTTVTLTVVALMEQQQTYTISASPASLTVPQGQQTASVITTTISGGFNSAISLSASGIPSGTTVSFSPNPIPAPGSGSSGMVVVVGSSTPTGTYPITVTGNGGGIQQNTTVTLTVTGQSQPSFTIAASPSSLTIPQGNQGTSTVATTISGGFNNAITLSASGMPSGTTVSFNPNPIPAPGSGNSTMTITVGSSTPVGTYPITVTGNGGGIQQNATVSLTVSAASGGWQQGFDFRNTSTYISDPSGDTYVLSTNAYPTQRNGVTFGWVKTSLVQARDRSTTVDPRLAGINYVNNGSPATFNVDLPSSGTYNLTLAMGDEGYPECYTQCQVQFLDGSTVLATVSGGTTNGGYFYDAEGKNWSAAAWPGSNLSQQVTLAGSRLTVVVGTSKATGDLTPIAFLGVAQASSGSPNFTISASPLSLTIPQGNQGNSTITTTISGGFNSSIGLSAAGMPAGTTVSFNPQTIPAPGSGNSTMTITVGASTPVGTYPITVTGNGSGIQQNTTVTLTVTAQSQPSFTIAASPSSLTIPQGNQGTSTVTTTISGGFNNAITLSASGMPSGTTVSFNPNPIPAPGSGNSTMTIIVGSGTPVGTYPITVTGNGGGIQQNATVSLTVSAASGGWQQGFDFRNTSTYISDPSGDTYVLSTNAYPTQRNGVTFGWVKTSLVQARDRSTKVDPRLAGINYVNNGSPATFNVDLPAAGSYNLTLAMGDEGYPECYTQCQVQFLDGSTVLATVSGGTTNAGYFYDAEGKNWSAAAWPGSNLSQQVTLAGSRLTVVVGTSKATGDLTPIAFLGVAQASSGSPNFTISASPLSLTIPQGNQGNSTITTTISGGFNSSIGLSAAGMPAGTTVSFNPQTIPAPGSGNSTMTITVGASTPVGTYPITVTGNGSGIQQNTTVTLTVTAQSQPSFTIAASPSSLTIPQGNQGTSTVTTTISGGFNNAITLSASGMPSGTTVSFNPNPIPAPGSGTSTMTITVGLSTPVGTYPITVTGNGGGIQQNATVSLTVTPSGGGGGGNGIVVYSTSGSPQANRFVSIGRFFKQGDIPHFAQAAVAGTGILTQCDVKNRWADGSLKFGIVSFIVPNVATTGTQVTFQDQASGNNTGYLAQADMLNAAYDFDGSIQLTGARSPSISARSMLQAGNFRYWLQGPIVTAVILEDRDNRTFDVNTDGASGNPLHPIVEAWFYPQTHQVEVGFTLENSWASSTAANSARNQTYSLALTTGFNSPATRLSQSSFTHLVFSRWRRSFWMDSTPAPIQIDYNWPYLASTAAYAHFNPTYTPNESDLENMYAVYTNEPAGRLTIPGIDDPYGDGGIVNYDENLNSAGYNPWIGPYSQWDVDYLMTGDSRMQQMMMDNADLSGRFPIFFREADHNAGTGRYFDAPGTGSVDPYGHVVSINARQYATLNLANLWDYSCNNNGADLIATGLPGDGSQWYYSPYDTSHMPDFGYVPYTLTGKYYYLEHEMLQAGFAAGNGPGCYYPAQGYDRQGHYGMLYSQTRGVAWALRTMAYAAFIAPDGAPEGPYFASKVINNIGMIEGEHSLPQTVTGADATWSYNWGQTQFQFSQAANLSTLNFWRMGDCQDGTTTCYVANGNGAANNVNAAIVQSAESSFMSSFIDIVLGLTNQLGVVDTTSILQHNAWRYFNILLNPAVNHYLIEQYVYPTTLVGPVCNNPANPGCIWIADWNTFQSGYLVLPTGWSTRQVDYGAEAASALSFMTKFTVNGYSGQNAWNFFTTSDSTQLGLVYHNEPQWSIEPMQ